MQYYRVLSHGRYFVIPGFTTRPWSQSGSNSQFASWLTVSLPAADVNICNRSLSLIWNPKVLKFNSNVSVHCSRCCFPNTYLFLFPYYWSLPHNIFLDGELRFFFFNQKEKKKLTDQKSLFAQATWLRRRCHITSVASPQRLMLGLWPCCCLMTITRSVMKTWCISGKKGLKWWIFHEPLQQPGSILVRLTAVSAGVSKSPPKN